jgi:hypothetical protein
MNTWSLVMERSTTSSENQLLDELLKTLLHRWGGAVVRRHLDVLEGKQGTRAKSRQIENRSKGVRRLTAYEYVEKRAQAFPERREALLELASRFDKKRFLPTVADVRNFLNTKEPDRKMIERREAAIAKIFQVLQSLSTEQLQGILRDENYAGPSRLGPLSEAIRESGAMRLGKD